MSGHTTEAEAGEYARPRSPSMRDFGVFADSDKAPDAAATTTTTGSINSEIVGRWILTFDWDCDGNPDEDETDFAPMVALEMMRKSQ